MSLLQMSFFGTVIILAVLVIRAVLFDQLPKRTFVVLWGIVLFRLLFPLEIPSEYSVYSLLGHNFGNVSVENVEAGQVRPNVGMDNGYAQRTLQQEPALSGNEVISQKSIKADNELSVQQPELSGTKITEQETGALSAGRLTWKSIVSQTEKLLSGWNDMFGKYIWLFVWGTGAFLCALFFNVTYVRCRKEFAMSLPVCNKFVEQWMEERILSQKNIFLHRFVRSIDVRVSDRIDTPLTYGIFHPVILLPKKTDWNNERQLEYILWHEYMHICHWDTAVKLIAVTAFCVHWFNPFVWLMYFLLGHDIEIACDESVVKKNGISRKCAYAHMLIDMEEKRSILRPLCSDFSRNGIEKRIRAIMKVKKFSAGAIILAVGLVMSVTLVFATSAIPSSAVASSAVPFSATSSSKGIVQVPSFATEFTEEEYEKLRTFCFDGYEDMSVVEYRNKALALADSEECWELLERFYLDKTLYKHRDDDETAAFVCYVLKPLTNMKWIENMFSGSLLCETAPEGMETVPGIAYLITLTISNENELTVGQYAAVSHGIVEELRMVLENRSEEQLASKKDMTAETVKTAEALEKKWAAYKLWVDVRAGYHPEGFVEGKESEAQLALLEEKTGSAIDLAVSVDGTEIAVDSEVLADGTVSTVDPGVLEEVTTVASEDLMEENRNMPEPSASPEDYHAMLSLMQADYGQMSVDDFNQALAAWKEKNRDAYERIMRDCHKGILDKNLSAEERKFITLTVCLSAVEANVWEQSIGNVILTNNASYCLYRRDNGSGAEMLFALTKSAESGKSRLVWGELNEFFAYRISDARQITVSERDRCVGGMLDDIQKYWDEIGMGGIFNRRNADIGVKMNELAKKYSNADITITIYSEYTESGWRERYDYE